MGKYYDFTNFFAGTVADWALCEVPDDEPDFYSWSGSTYWDLGDRVRRWSNHWGPGIRSCTWYLVYHVLRLREGLCGECLYEDFRPTRSLLDETLVVAVPQQVVLADQWGLAEARLAVDAA